MFTAVPISPPSERTNFRRQGVQDRCGLFKIEGAPDLGIDLPPEDGFDAGFEVERHGQQQCQQEENDSYSYFKPFFQLHGID